jgi:hypothetical protein
MSLGQTCCRRGTKVSKSVIEATNPKAIIRYRDERSNRTLMRFTKLEPLSNCRLLGAYTEKTILDFGRQWTYRFAAFF